MKPKLTAREKRVFIRTLCNAVCACIIKDVGKMPVEWSGIELREVIANRFDRETFLTKRTYTARPGDRKRVREISNECAVRGI